MKKYHKNQVLKPFSLFDSAPQPRGAGLYLSSMISAPDGCGG